MKFYGEKFKKLKKLKKITSVKLAELLGTTRQTIYAWENGLYSPKQSDILLICEILNITPEEISDIHSDNSYKKIETLKKERLLLEEEKDLKELINSKTLSDREAASIINITAKLNEYKNIHKRQVSLISNYERILNNIEQIVYVKDSNHKYKYVNESFLSITGTEAFKDEIKNISYSTIFEKTDYHELLKLEREVFKTGININNHKIFIPNTERRQIGLVNIIPKFENSKQEVIEIIVTIKDITKLSYTMERQEQLTDIINSLDECVYIRTVSSFRNRYIFLSSTVENIYGYIPEDFYEDSELWHKLILEEDRKNLIKDETTGYLPEGKWIYRIIRKDGKIRWLSNCVFYKTGISGNDIIFGSIADITESYLIQKDREELERAVDLSNTVVWVGDTNLQKSPEAPLPLTFISDNIYSHLGIHKDEFIKDSSKWLDTVYEEDYKKALEFRKLQVYPKSLDFRVITKEKNIKWINLKIDKKNNYIYGVIRDFTEAKKAEQERIELHEAINNSESLIIVDRQLKKDDKETYYYAYIGNKIENYWNISKNDLYREHNIWQKCIVEEDRQRVIDSYKRDKDEIYNEYRVMDKNGNIKWLSHRSVRKKHAVYSYINFIVQHSS